MLALSVLLVEALRERDGEGCQVITCLRDLAEALYPQKLGREWSGMFIDYILDEGVFCGPS